MNDDRSVNSSSLEHSLVIVHPSFFVGNLCLVMFSFAFLPLQRVSQTVQIINVQGNPVRVLY